MTISTESASFGPELFAFLAELRDHNDRDWFAANKPRYESAVLEPASLAPTKRNSRKSFVS